MRCWCRAQTMGENVTPAQARQTADSQGIRVLCVAMGKKVRGGAQAFIGFLPQWEFRGAVDSPRSGGIRITGVKDYGSQSRWRKRISALNYIPKGLAKNSEGQRLRKELLPSGGNFMVGFFR